VENSKGCWKKKKKKSLFMLWTLKNQQQCSSSGVLTLPIVTYKVSWCLILNLLLLLLLM
jgi:hypothetical protein